MSHDILTVKKEEEFEHVHTFHNNTKFIPGFFIFFSVFKIESVNSLFCEMTMTYFT